MNDVVEFFVDASKAPFEKAKGVLNGKDTSPTKAQRAAMQKREAAAEARQRTLSEQTRARQAVRRRGGSRRLLFEGNLGQKDTLG